MGTKKPRHRVTPGRVRRPPHQKGRSTKPGQASGLRGGGQDRRAGRTPLPSQLSASVSCHLRMALICDLRFPLVCGPQHSAISPYAELIRWPQHAQHPGHGRRRSPMWYLERMAITSRTYSRCCASSVPCCRANHHLRSIWKRTKRLRADWLIPTRDRAVINFGSTTPGTSGMCLRA